MNDKAFENLKENIRHHYRMLCLFQAKYLVETGRDFDTSSVSMKKVPAHRRACEVYTPDAAPEIEVYYEVLPPQEKTFNQPGYPFEIDVLDILVHGQDVSEPVYDLLSKRDLESEILAQLKRRAADDRADKAIEALEIRQLEGRSA